MPYQNAVTPFCHVFNAEDEEDFLESETRQFRQKIHGLLAQLRMQDPRLIKIQLDFGVGKQEISALSEAIRRSPFVQCLKISNWPIGDYGAECLARVLADKKSLCRLKELSLRTCGIQSTGAKAIFTALESNNTCVKLDLSRNNLRFGSESIAQVFERSIPRITALEELDLSLGCLDEACMRSLLCGLTTNFGLRVLHLKDNSANVRETFGMVVEFLPHLNNLERLILSSGGGSLIQRNDSYETLLFLLQQLQLLGERIMRQTPPRLYDLGTLCASCHIDRHGSLEKQRLQQQCHEQMRLIHLYLDTNRIQSSGVLWCDDPKMLPFSVAQTNRMRSSVDAMFYLLRRKVDCFMHVG
jgi:hypothetical protein